MNYQFLSRQFLYSTFIGGPTSPSGPHGLFVLHGFLQCAVVAAAKSASAVTLHQFQKQSRPARNGFAESLNEVPPFITIRERPDFAQFLNQSGKLPKSAR
jgi:hypothetical protein